MSVTEKIRLLLNVSGLTQTELASKLGVSFVTLNRWYHGHTKPRATAIQRMNELYIALTGNQLVADSFINHKKQAVIGGTKTLGSPLKLIFKRPDLYDELILKLTWTSNCIEGSTLTQADTANILFHDSTIRGKSVTEHLAMKNHQVALEYLLQTLKNKQPLNETRLLRLHILLMNGLIEDAGSFRRQGVRIVGAEVTTAAAEAVPALMKELLSNCKKPTSDPIGQATRIHSRFEQIHPFADGNGRLGRLLLQAMLLKANLPPALIHHQQKSYYYHHLERAQTIGDISLLEELICDAMLDTLAIMRD